LWAIFRDSAPIHDIQQYRLAIPSNKVYSVPQLQMMMHEIEVILGRQITPEEWQNPGRHQSFSNFILNHVNKVAGQ
jgi:hypothetical protein